MSVADPRSDVELVAGIVERDRGALHALYLRHEPWLTARLSRRCADPQMVEEAVQDTFVAVWKTAARFEGRGDVAAWIWGVGIRTLLHALRPRKNLLDRLRSQRTTAEVESAEEQVLLGIDHGGLGPALDQLSPELRAVVQATILDGLSTKEAATLLQIPAGTVKTRMMRAKRELREALS